MIEYEGVRETCATGEQLEKAQKQAEQRAEDERWLRQWRCVPVSRTPEEENALR